MRRRRSGIIWAWVSAILCALALVMWGRSRWQMDSVELHTQYHITLLINKDGSILLSLIDLDFTLPQWMTPETAPQPASNWSWRFGHSDVDTAFLSPIFDIRSEPPHGRVAWSVRIPWWPIVLALAILPAFRLIQVARARRPHLPGHCPRCGYDLRATPTRCPECGLAVNQEANA